MSANALSATQIRETDIAPRCASCFSQNTERRHVDMGAAYDGPTFPDPDVQGFAVESIDSLILCEDCVRLAAGCLGMVEPDGRKEIKAELAAALERLEGAKAYIQAAERADDQRKLLIKLLGPAGEPKAKGK